MDDDIIAFVQEALSRMQAENFFSGVIERLREDELYAAVANELREGRWDEVAQLRAIEQAGGDTERAKALYPGQRVRRLKDMAVMDAAGAHLERAVRRAEDDALQAAARAEEDRLRKGIPYRGYTIRMISPNTYAIFEVGVLLSSAPTFPDVAKAKRHIDAISL